MGESLNGTTGKLKKEAVMGVSVKTELFKQTT
jgi:hypothetical protein